MPHSSPPAAKNKLLQTLSRQDREELLGKGAHVELVFGEVLCQPDQRIRYAFFPDSGVISLITPIDAHASLEVAIVGDEGMLGLPLVFGSTVAPLRAIVQGPGTAWRVKAGSFRRALERSSSLQRGLNRYLDVMLRQLARTAVCTHFHVVESRLARWLLMTSDRMHSDEFYITQEFMSSMLGVRRAGVNHAASLLRDRKLIHYVRGQLTILNRRGLKAAACSCYAATKETYSRILS